MRLQIRLKRRMRWNETRDRREKKARTQLYLYDLFKWRPFKRGLRAKKNEIGRGLWAEEDWLGRGELWTQVSFKQPKRMKDYSND